MVIKVALVALKYCEVPSTKHNKRVHMIEPINYQRLIYNE